MTEATRAAVEDFFQQNRENILRDVSRLVAIPSEKGEKKDNMPYGEGPYRALKCAESLMEEAGLLVRNWDNRVVSGDLTALEAGLDILAHVDVVPCDKNWDVCNPYEPVLLDGKLYGRGTMDDKGPAVAALYAMKCVRELGILLKKNVRLILGSDEECGSSDVEYYYSRNSEAPMTFSPDANFPLINLEKGRFSSEVYANYSASDERPAVVSVSSGIKSNVVPDEAEAVIVGFRPEELERYVLSSEKESGAAFTLETTGSGVIVRCRGKSSHAAMPEGGNNALTALLQFLVSLPCAETEAFRALKALHSIFPHGDYHGCALGIDMSDDISGAMTCSADMLSFTPTALSLTFDARCPVCANEENTKGVLIRSAEAVGLSVKDSRMVLPHYVDENCDFIRTLLRVYSEWTGLPGKAESTGGGTYVHDLQRGVAFGCETEGIDNRIHGANEFITEEQLFLSSKIFTQAIIELCG